MRGVLENMDSAGFEEHKKGLVQKWTEKLKNMNEETSRFWSHVESGYLDFARREHDTALLSSITKEDVLAMFKEFIDPISTTRSKLSVHMRPQKTPAIKLSSQAAQSFLASLRNASVIVDEDEYNSLCADEPPAATVRSHWENTFREQQNKEAASLLAEFDTHVRTHPAVGQGSIELSPSAVFITDGAAFKDTLALSGPAKPVKPVENFELPPSKL